MNGVRYEQGTPVKRRKPLGRAWCMKLAAEIMVGSGGLLGGSAAPGSVAIREARLKQPVAQRGGHSQPLRLSADFHGATAVSAVGGREVTASSLSSHG